MSVDQLPLFLNPAAGRGRARKLAPLIAAIFADHDIQVDLLESTAVGDLEKKVRLTAKAGAEKIVVAGGDGSVHEAVNGVLGAGSDTAIGIIPIGTGNDFAKSTDTPLNWQQSCESLAQRIKGNLPARSVDAGSLNNRFFANGAGIGFDAKINSIAKKYTWPIGDVVYLLAVFEGLWDGVITPNVKISCDDFDYEGPITLANISNGAWVGGLFHIAPMATVDDGLLDVVIADPMSRTRIATLLPKLRRGKHIGEAGIRHLRTEAFHLSSVAPIPCHLDGESQPLQKIFEIRILKNALSIL